MKTVRNKIIFVIVILMTAFTNNFFSYVFASLDHLSNLPSSNTDTTHTKKKHFLKNAKVLIGFGNTNLSISSKQDYGNYLTEGRAGILGGVMLETSFFDIEFGLMYMGKNFLLTPPHSLGQYGIDTNSYKTKNQYLSIPINYDFLVFTINDVFHLTFGVGPYFAFLLSTNESSGLGIKKFDFGIDGRLYATYDISKKVNPLVGLIYQYGGLNNMTTTNYVNKTHSSNFSFFGGVIIKL